MKPETTQRTAQWLHGSVIGASLFLCLWSLTLLLSGCAVGPNYRRPAVTAPAQFRSAPETNSTASLADMPWWAMFKDQTLTNLIQTALTNNYDIRIAMHRVEQSYALAVQTRSQFFPQIGYDGNAASGKNSLFGSPSPLGLAGRTGPGDSFLALFNASWEVDLWGRIRRLDESARAQYLASEEACRGLRPAASAECRRTHHHQHAHEPGQRRQDAAPANALAQHRDGQHRHDQRRGKFQGVGVRECRWRQDRYQAMVVNEDRPERSATPVRRTGINRAKPRPLHSSRSPRRRLPRRRNRATAWPNRHWWPGSPISRRCLRWSGSGTTRRPADAADRVGGVVGQDADGRASGHRLGACPNSRTSQPAAHATLPSRSRRIARSPGLRRAGLRHAVRSAEMSRGSGFNQIGKDPPLPTKSSRSKFTVHILVVTVSHAGEMCPVFSPHVKNYASF